MDQHIVGGGTSNSRGPVAKALRPSVAAALVIVFFLAFALQARTERSPRCDGRHVSILGTPGDDVLVGTKHRDVIAALGGNDIISGAGRDDVICGGDGIDTVTYAASRVAVQVDLATGVATGEGTDRLFDVENVVGSSFADTLTGNDSDNTLAGGPGDDTLTGGGGSDTADYSSAPSGVTVDLEAGTATGDGSDRLAGIQNVIGSSFADDLFGDEGANALSGGAGDDLLQGFGGSDALAAGDGSDIVRGGEGADAADGGAGTDACVDVESSTGCERGGGTLNVVLPLDVDYTDPALDYLAQGWQLEFATCLKLMNFADDLSASAGPLPEAAAGLPLVSADGLTYTFTIREGIRFAPPSNEMLTAANFKHEFDRLESPVMQSPAVPFFSDVTSVTAVGQTLTFSLARPAPDFLSRLAMPFMCAVPTDLPLDPNGVLVPSAAGPYSIVARQPNVEIDLQRNPNYRGRRPSNFDRIVYHIGSSLDAAQTAVEGGTADYAAGGIPPARYAAVAASYGPGSPAAVAGRQRFFVNPALGFNYIGLNTSRPVFANETLRRAVATALDRTSLILPAGQFAGTASDQYLAPGIPGFVDAQIYPLTGDLGTASALAASQGVTPATPVAVELYTSDRDPALERAGIIQRTLAQIGFDVRIHVFSRAEQIGRDHTRGEPFDLTLEGWLVDYNDPFDVINVLLDGRNIGPVNNNNVSYFNDATFNARMDAAEQLTGQARYDAYASLEHDLVRAAPLVAYSTINNRDYFADRIGCQSYSSFGMSLGSLCIH